MPFFFYYPGNLEVGNTGVGKVILNTDCSGAANRESLHAVDTFSSSKLYIYSSTKEDPETNNELFVNW